MAARMLRLQLLAAAAPALVLCRCNHALRGCAQPLLSLCQRPVPAVRRVQFDGQQRDGDGEDVASAVIILVGLAFVDLRSFSLDFLWF